PPSESAAQVQKKHPRRLFSSGGGAGCVPVTFKTGQAGPELSTTQEARNFQIVGVVFLRLFDSWMCRRNRSGRDCGGGCRTLLDRGRLPLVHRTLETPDRASCFEGGRDHGDLDLSAHALVDDRSEDDVRLGVG